jgi:hypothetical protein
MRRFGYTDVHNETNLVLTKDWDNVLEADKYYSKGDIVTLFIAADMLTSSKQENFSAISDHWGGMVSSCTSSAIQSDPAAQISLRTPNKTHLTRCV